MENKKWSFGKKFFVFLILLVIVGAVARFYMPKFGSDKALIKKNEILHLQIDGVIMNGKKFLYNLDKYSDDSEIKAILIEINSPGGAVGPSQELYYAILRAKEKTKKPIICVSTSLIASGGYYAAMGCDKLIVTPGSMVGSIGVIMEFANLEELYGWAKVKRYSIKSGKFKDSGAEYRAMRDDERKLFQDMIDEVFVQFKETVMKGRNLSDAVVSEYADGRVMTGAKAVKLGFADELGTFQDAVEYTAKVAKMGDDYELYKPHKEQKYWFEYILDQNDQEDDLNSVSNRDVQARIGSNDLMSAGAEAIVKKVLKTNLLNQPLYLMPGYWQ